ncbi:hypothetical protein CALVIDRAFT_73211 [Calocera viscosa TUFC12733]|uniref:BAG domain-containing protein n=1 Tax=Calocera viscosa (strain TUFC12733) TaxID=1330018 RepID=A0A167NCF2_CALVF|nr:hypothetical protein CALVIDRAFT_73211 [Calocera viscosa TUFC12733]
MFAYPYGYSRQPTPLYPTNRRPQPRHSDPEETYLRAVARERAQREAAARAYNPFFGFAPQADEEDEEEEGYYIPRSRQEVYEARRRAEHERQLREREALNAHLAEQRRQQQRTQAQQHHAQRRSTSPTRASPPAQVERTNAKPEPQPSESPATSDPQQASDPTTAPNPQPTAEQQAKAATLIQAAWRAHALRQHAKAELDKIATKLSVLQDAFTLPETLDFDLTSSAAASPAFGDEDDQASAGPKLLYNAHNTPVRAQEHALTLLLQDLDGVESHGDPSIRMRRKALVGRVEQALRELERGVREVWERRYGQPDATSSSQEGENEQQQEGEEDEEPTPRAGDVPLPHAQAQDMDVDTAGTTPTPEVLPQPEPEEEDGWEHLTPAELAEADEREVDAELPTAAPTPAQDAMDTDGDDTEGEETETEWEGFQTAEEPEMDEPEQSESEQVPSKVPVRIPSPPRQGPWRVLIQ